MANRFTTPNNVVVVCDFPGYTSQTFKSMDAVRKGGTATPYYDGGATTADLLSGTAEFGTAKISRGWIRSRDMALFAYLDPLVMSLFFTVTKKVTDENLVGGTQTFVYQVLLTGLTDLAAMTGPSTEPATLDLDVTIQSRRVTA